MRHAFKNQISGAGLVSKRLLVPDLLEYKESWRDPGLLRASQFCVTEQAADGMISDFDKCFHPLCRGFYCSVQYNVYMNC